MGVELMEWGEGADDAIVGAGVGEFYHIRRNVGTDGKNENLQLLNSSHSFPETPTPP